MNNIKSLLVLSGTVFCVGAAHAFIDQSDYDTSIGYFSAAAPGAFANFAEYEDFTIGSAQTVRQIGWAGMTENWNTGVLPDNVIGFQVSIYGHDGGNGRPDTSNNIFTQVYALASTGTTNVGPGYGGVSQAYTHVVSTPDVNLGAGTYWLHVGAIYIDGQNGFNWAWMATLSTYNGTSANYNWGAATWGTNPDDLSMSLSSVPEPGTFIAIGLGVLGLAFSRRRKA